MNSPQAKLQRARDAEASEAPDLKKFKTDLLGKVIVKTIVKQQVNDRRVSALEFNRLPGGKCGNLFATLAGDFATVYDDEHFGDHVAVVAQFKNDKTAHVAGAISPRSRGWTGRGTPSTSSGTPSSRSAAATTTRFRS